MIQILCESKEEYEVAKAMVKNLNEEINVSVFSPEDCVGATYWSVDDLVAENYFPEDTPIEHLEAALYYLRDQLHENMTADGWNTISAFESEMYEYVESKCGIDYRDKLEDNDEVCL